MLATVKLKIGFGREPLTLDGVTFNLSHQLILVNKTEQTFTMIHLMTNYVETIRLTWVFNKNTTGATLKY